MGSQKESEGSLRLSSQEVCPRTRVTPGRVCREPERAHGPEACWTSKAVSAQRCSHLLSSLSLFTCFVWPLCTARRAHSSLTPGCTMQCCYVRAARTQLLHPEQLPLKLGLWLMCKAQVGLFCPGHQNTYGFCVPFIRLTASAAPNMRLIFAIWVLFEVQLF